ncbi:hypothetical protein [Streptomyces cyanogenus]|uniref:hypothetical protein n=1 Tax=Streptomyces cyanogenus TaxID=80860 RepID=UPI001AA18725|nr:hypothetical protein [Streptomyces cyanogenus]
MATGALLTTPAASAGAASSDTQRSAFSAQAEQAGLTAPQRAALQQRVDAILAQDGGQQTAANEISYPDGRLLLPLPGEKRARDLNSPANVAAAAHTCTPGNLCGYSGAGYTGEEREWYTCTFHKKPSSWTSGGSWYNNQTPGRVANWYDANKRWLGSTPPAPYGTEHGQWRGVGYAKPC